MTNNSANIVHEAESQRQHVRVDLPAHVEINNAIYETENWSTGGVNFYLGQAPATTFKTKHVYQAHLIFKMDSFDLSVPMSLEICHINEKTGSVGTRFDNMNERQISIMQHLVGSYVTGDITNVNDLIHVVGRNNMTSPRKIPKKEELTFPQKIKSLLTRMIIPVASLALFSYVAISVYEQNYIVTATSAIVTANALSLEAPSAGTVSLKDLKPGDKINKGEVLLSVTSSSGVISGVDSTCDCLLQEYTVDFGDVVKTGQQLVKLVPENAPLFVEASVSYKKAVRLAKGDVAYIINKANHLQIPASITGINAKDGSSATATITLLPEQKIPEALLGAPVEVKIDTLGWTN